MRKMKKINGYLVVRFNDREKREYEGTGLGSYGVIDAELYTGVLDVDRCVMEYDSAETLEEAVEQARGLESELDIVEPEATVTVIVEREAEVSEETVDPAELFQMEQARLEGRILDKEYPEVVPVSAAHQLEGYAQALADLGMIEPADERFSVPLEWLDSNCPSVRSWENALSYICDNLCRHRAEQISQEALDAICEDCEVGRNFLRGVGDYADGKPAAPPPRNRFIHLPPERWKGRTAADLYHLGKQLEKDCPENDCEIYRNIFRMAKELDESLDSLGGYTAEILQRELSSRVRELRRMYFENYAVKKYREAWECSNKLPEGTASSEQTVSNEEGLHPNPAEYNRSQMREAYKEQCQYNLAVETVYCAILLNENSDIPLTQRTKLLQTLPAVYQKKDMGKFIGTAHYYAINRVSVLI